jgi:hypothetical protein
MADTIKDRDNKDAEESGRPVQLDPEKQGGGIDEPQQDEQDMEQGGQKHGQQPAGDR